MGESRIRSATLKRWAPLVAWGVYGLLLMAETLRTWLKFDGETAGKVFGLGLVLGVVLWRAWRYTRAILFGYRPAKRTAKRPAE